MVNANILAAESDAYGVFNVGAGKSISINELVELISRLPESDIKPIHQELRPGDVRHSLADISKAKTFGYAPRDSLEEGLKEIIERFSNKR